MSLYDNVGFEYTLKASDAGNLDDGTADIFASRDRQLSNFTVDLKNQVVSAVAGKLNADDIRWDSVIITLPQVGGSTNITYYNPFDSIYANENNFALIAINGDPQATSPVAVLGFKALDNTRFRVTLISGPAGGTAQVRVNYICMAFLP